jgi:O-antigen/teichoic acid export membrane protein
MDQGLTSGAGFAVNLLLARWMAPEVYGAFAVAFAGFLFVSGFHNVLLLEPMSVLGPSRYAKRLPTYFRAQIVVHLVLVGPLSALALLASLVLWRIATGSPLSGAVLGAGLTLPFLLLFWLVRRMCYVVYRPSAAALGSGLYLSFVAAGLFVLGHYAWLGPFTAFLLMGCGSTVASGLLLWRLGLGESETTAEPNVSWRVALRENWGYGRWLVGSAVLFAVTSQTQTLLAAGILGLGAAGILRAMQIPSLVMVQIITAAGLVVLPSFSYDFGRGRAEQLRHKAMIVSLGLAIVALCFAATLALFAGRVEHLLFGGKYAAYAWLMPVLALVPAANGISIGYSMALRALQRPHFDLISNIFAAPVAVVSAFFLMRWWGLAGAAASLALSFAILSVVTIVFFQRSTRNPGGMTDTNNG